MNETDAILLDSWTRERDAEAFKTLAARYAGMVYGTCKRILNNPTDAEDAAQECFEVLATTQKPVGEYLGAWLHRVACNKSLTRLRSERRRTERDTQFAVVLDAAREVAWNDIYSFVDEAIAELPDELRIPVVAHFLDDQTHVAIAEALGVPRTTITHRIERGIETLRKTLAGKGVAVTGLVLAGLLAANTAEAAPSTLITNLGRLALSGAKGAPIPAAATAAAKVSAGFWTAKTVIAAVVGLAVLAGGTAGYVAVRKLVPIGSVTAPLVSLQQAVKNTLPTGAQTGVPHSGVPGRTSTEAASFLPLKLLGTVSGRVYDMATGKGIPFSSVCARGPSGETKVFASFSGEYAIDGLIPGRYDLSAFAPFGYLNAGVSNEKCVEVQPGAKVARLDFERAKGVSVSGVVRDHAGRPVAEAEVSASAMAGPRLPECVSGKDGTFLLSGLHPNQPDISLRAQGNGMVTPPAMQCSVGADNLEGVELVLEPGARISGQLVNGAGKPVSGMKMLAWPKSSRGGTALPSSTTDKQGSFDFFSLEEGGYYLTVDPPGSHTRKNNTLDEVEVDRGEEMRGLVLVYDLTAGMRITGRVTNSSGKPVPGTEVSCYGAISASTLAGEDGRFELARLPEGYYTLYTRDRIVKNRFLPDGKDVDIVLPDAGRVQCRIVDAATGKPVSRFQAQAIEAGVPLYAEQDAFMRHVYDADGRYWMDLVPGDYRMCVRAPGYRVALKDMHVSAASETPAEEEIALEPAPPLEVRVADAQGNPVGGAGIYLFPQDTSKGVMLYGAERFAPNHTPFGKTGEDGVFRSDWLTLDDGFVYVKHPSYAPASAPMRLGEPMQVYLHQGGAVQGTVQVDGEAPWVVQMGIRYLDQQELGTLWADPGSDGQFRIDHARPGDALACAKATWRASGDRHYSEEVTQAIRIGDSGTTDVALHISRGNCTLTGGVYLEGKPFGEFWVEVAVTSADGGRTRRSTTTGADGGFLLDDLPVGESLVSVLPSGPQTNIPAVPTAPMAVSILPDQDNRAEFAFAANDLK